MNLSTRVRHNCESCHLALSQATRRMRIRRICSIPCIKLDGRERLTAPNLDDMDWMDADAWQSKRADFLAYSWQKHDCSLELFLKASQASLLSSPLMFGLPSSLSDQCKAESSSLWSEWYCESFYDGQEERMRKDNEYYSDGLFLLSRDLEKKGGMLLSTNEEERKQSRPLLSDLGSMISFSFIAMNTFPFTGLVVDTMLKKMPNWIPRQWIVPSQFEETRLARYRRARSLVTRRKDKETTDDAGG